MEENKETKDPRDTDFLYEQHESYLGIPKPVQNTEPRLFVCSEHEIIEFILTGRQVLGRPTEDNIPDIPVMNSYVSRFHGVFETTKDMVTFTAGDTKNGTVFRRQVLSPGQTVELWDGDELIIPVEEKGRDVDILLVCAIVESRIKIWRELSLASRDSLTGLMGRNAFRTWYIHTCTYKEQERLCLFILDIDHFKTINDTFGHSTGDEVLHLFTDELLNMVGNFGKVCRWGGDEFVGVVMMDLAEALKALSDMSIRISHSELRDGVSLTLSAGLLDVTKTDSRENFDRLVELADTALYRAKEEGRDRICIAEI